MSSPCDRTLLTRQASKMPSSTPRPPSPAPATPSTVAMYTTSTGATAAALASQQLSFCHRNQETPAHALFFCSCYRILALLGLLIGVLSFWLLPAAHRFRFGIKRNLPFQIQPEQQKRFRTTETPKITQLSLERACRSQDFQAASRAPWEGFLCACYRATHLP